MAAIDATLQRLTVEATDELAGQGFTGTPRLLRSIGMRYAGQNYERDVPVPAGPITGDMFAVLLDRFHESHRRFYGHHFPDETIEIIHFNVTALGQGARLALPELEPGAAPAPRAMRRVCLDDPRARIECPIYRRSDLRAGCTIDGPAVIEEPDSTIFLLPDHRLSVTAEGICRITAPESSATTGSGSIGPGAESAPVDAITMSVIDHRLVNVTREMGTAMMRTAYSPIFSESKDLSCAVFDAQGEMIAQGEFCPAQLGAIPHAVRWTIEELGLDSFAPGDVVVHNDPYRGGCHMPEHLMLKPVFDGERLVMFVAVIGHVAEIGAKVVGSFASDATEVFQEGLRLPPVKLMRAGEYVREVWRIILANHRTPRNTWGDFHAMLGALNVGERRCLELLQRYGTRRVLRATQQLIAYSERLMRAELRGIADGEYTAEEQMEDDGISDRPYTIRATVVVRDGQLLVDYTGTDAQAQGPINATFGATASATYNAVLQLVGSHIPRNSGCYRPLEIIAPPGSVVNVRYPGPSVGGNTEGQPRIVGVILRALSRAVPERVMASEGATSCNFLFGGAHPRTGSAYAHYHFEASGWGGRWRTDGNSAQNHIHGNCRNTPVEIFETMFPFVVLRYGLNPDSGGAGARRGGLGTRRELRVAAPEITVSMMMDHVKEGAEGLAGGDAGGLGGIWVRRRGEREYRTFVDAFGVVSPSKFANVAVTDGDEIRIDSAGGGGYGDPRERDPRLVVRDVAQGFVSPAAAERRYGVRVTVDGHGAVELAGTVRGRSRPGGGERGGAGWRVRRGVAGVAGVVGASTARRSSSPAPAAAWDAAPRCCLRARGRASRCATTGNLPWPPRSTPSAARTARRWGPWPTCHGQRRWRRPSSWRWIPTAGSTCCTTTPACGCPPTARPPTWTKRRGTASSASTSRARFSAASTPSRTCARPAAAPSSTSRRCPRCAPARTSSTRTPQARAASSPSPTALRAPGGRTRSAPT